MRVPESVEAGSLDLQDIKQRPQMIIDDLLRRVCAAVPIAEQQAERVRLPRFQILAEEPFQCGGNGQTVFTRFILRCLELTSPRALSNVNSSRGQVNVLGL